MFFERRIVSIIFSICFTQQTSAPEGWAFWPLFRHHGSHEADVHRWRRRNEAHDRQGVDRSSWEENHCWLPMIEAYPISSEDLNCEREILRKLFSRYGRMIFRQRIFEMQNCKCFRLSQTLWFSMAYDHRLWMWIKAARTFSIATKGKCTCQIISDPKLVFAYRAKSHIGILWCLYVGHKELYTYNNFRLSFCYAFVQQSLVRTLNTDQLENNPCKRYTQSHYNQGGWRAGVPTSNKEFKQLSVFCGYTKEFHRCSGVFNARCSMLPTSWEELKMGFLIWQNINNISHAFWSNKIISYLVRNFDRWKQTVQENITVIFNQSCILGKRKLYTSDMPNLTLFQSSPTNEIEISWNFKI